MALDKRTIENVLSKTIPNDRIASQLLNAAKETNVNLNDAFQIAVVLANVAAAKNMDENGIVDTALDAFKSVLYVEYVRHTGDKFDVSMHNDLTSRAERAITMYKQIMAKQSSGGSLLGGGGSSRSLLGGGSRVNGVISTEVMKVDNTINVSHSSAQSGVGLSSGFIDSTAPTSPVKEEAKVEAQQMAIPQNQPVRITPTAPDVTINEPVVNSMLVTLMETYSAHELRSTLIASAQSPKDANVAVKAYADVKDWKKPLEKILSGELERAVFYPECGITVTPRVTRESFIMGEDDTTVDLVESLLIRYAEFIASLEELYKIDDVEKLMDAVMEQINVSRTLCNELVKNAQTNTSGKINQYGPAQLQSVLVAYTDLLVHNGIALASNRTKENPDGNEVLLERRASDLEYFREDLYSATVGENGINEHIDFFRDLFLSVANSMRKLDISAVDGTVWLTQTDITIGIPADYTSAEKGNVVSAQTLGATQAPVTAIYEAVLAELPEANVFMQLPRGTHMLLSNGEPVSGIRY